MRFSQSEQNFTHEGLFQIGEVAQACGVSRKAILFYEQHGLLSPTAANASSGYRYYDAEAVSRLMLILELRSAGLSIAEIGAYLSGGRAATAAVIALMEQRLAALREGLERLRALAVEPGDCRVGWTSRPAQRCLVWRYDCHGVQEAVDCVFHAYGEALRQRLPIRGTNGIFAEYDHDFQFGQPLNLDAFTMRVCLPLAAGATDMEGVDFPAIQGIYVNYRGEYAGLGAAYAALAGYVRSNGLTPTAPVREYYLDGGREGGGETERHVTRILLPVRERRQEK